MLYCSVSRYGYYVPCGVYHDTLVYRSGTPQHRRENTTCSDVCCWHCREWVRADELGTHAWREWTLGHNPCRCPAAKCLDQQSTGAKYLMQYQLTQQNVVVLAYFWKTSYKTAVTAREHVINTTRSQVWDADLTLESVALSQTCCLLQLLYTIYFVRCIYYRFYRVKNQDHNNVQL